jgi:protein SCO1
LVLLGSFFDLCGYPGFGEFLCIAEYPGEEKKEEWYVIEKDLVAKNQAGDEVRLSDLRGKVWVVAEFFAVCPHCAARNGAELRALYERFKDEPDFHIVCVTVDPVEDDVEKLKTYAEALGADVSRWWFLNAGEEKVTHEYMEKNLKFFGIRERSDAADIKANGRFQHDMGLMLVNKEFQVVGKWPLYDAKSEDAEKRNPGLYERLKAEMVARIELELEKK